jgi:hypothetical protein
MANIRLKELVEANIDPKLTARSKETGKLVYFKTPQAKDAAMKAGTHEDPKAKKGETPKAAAKPNSMFGADYKKDRGGNDFKSSAETGNYTFTPKDAEKKYKSAAISMVIPKLNPKDIPNIQKQLSKMDVDADFNVEKGGVRIWTRSGDWSNVGDVLKSKGLKRKQTMPTDADYQKWDDKRRASSGIKPTGSDKKPAPTANIVNKPKDPTATPQNLQKLAQLKQQVAAPKDDKKLNKLLNKHGITKDLAKKANDEATKLAASISKGKAPEDINPGDGKDMANSIKDSKLNQDGTTKELTSKLQKSPYGKFVKDDKNDNMTFFFYDGSKYEMHIDRATKSITTKDLLHPEESDANRLHMFKNLFN